MKPVYKFNGEASAFYDGKDNFPYVDIDGDVWIDANTFYSNTCAIRIKKNNVLSAYEQAYFYKIKRLERL